MELQHIELEDLKLTTVNVRKKGGKDVTNLVPSIRSLGVLQPLLVRPNCEGYEIVAGQRRYHALLALATEDEGQPDPVPCIVMDKGDDAKAIEASLAENVARLPMDEIDQYKAFADLSKQGADIPEIANRFGITERLVKQRLAIANIIPPILTAYRKGDIHPETLRILTMASKKQQKAWLELYRSDDDHAPEGHRLKSWLFGGTQVPTENALFDLADYDGNIVSNLFGEDSYFDDAEKFWKLQNTAIAKAKEAYLVDGWSDVTVFDVGEYFPSYEYVDTAKEEGGKVYVSVAHDGEVTFYEGQLSRKEIKARENAAQNGEKTTATKPELTKAMQNYLDLHRHSAVRTTLLNDSGIALRLVVAQIIAGSNLWQIQAEPQKANSEAIADSLAANKAEDKFAEERQAVCKLLGIETDEDDTLVPRKQDWGVSRDLHALFARLLALGDDEVMRILAFVVAETLSCGTAMVDVLGKLLGASLKGCWSPDQTFFDLLRDKQTINAIVSEVAGKNTADAHLTETAKVQKKIIQNCLNGERTCENPNWQPRYMEFAMRGYTDQGGIRAIDDWQTVSHHYT